jgi:UDP-N-acetylglucosamine transferase subunit ALG13
MKSLNIQAVISDNRYGLYNKNIHSIFITHQLTIDTPYRSLTSFIQFLNYQRIENFDECWVPDFKDEQLNIAGKLSHPNKKPKLPVHYIGLLSRFTAKKMKIEYDHLALISGPEPQRSLFESKIRKYFPYLNGKKSLVLGKPNKFREAENEDSIEIHNHVEAKELESMIASSKAIVCRAGYSTIMDLIAMKKTALLIPTPGQTEQEYLAERLKEQKWFSASSQNDLNAAVITQSADESFVIPAFEDFDLNSFLKEFLKRISK